MPSLTRAMRRTFRRATLCRPVIRVYDRFASGNLSLGQRGEIAAERYLLKRGLVIVARGFENSFGEIDLIAIDDRTVVFVEVKTRSSDEFGSPAEAVDGSKQEKLSKTAMAYLHRHRLLEFRARFDVIAITWPNGQEYPDIEYVPNAFEVVGDGQMFN